MDKNIRIVSSVVLILGLIVSLIFRWRLNYWWIVFGVVQAYNAYLESKVSNKRWYMYFWIVFILLWILLTII